jgi:hypothetical protein
VTARDAWGQVAHNLRALADSIDAAIEQPERERAPRPAPADYPKGVEATAPAAKQAATAVASNVDTSRCPKHGVPWEPGQYGEYCKQRTDDPAWGKEKTDRDGNKVLWCKLTPKNAPHWVGVHGAATAMDADDLSF